MNQIRQGDVLLHPTQTPIGKPIPIGKDAKTILAYGEVTGHHHRFHGPDVQMFRDDGGVGATFVDLKKPKKLIHEEHGSILIKKGCYQQAFQVEYTPAEIRRVAD